jgi:hypothetical protein
LDLPISGSLNDPQFSLGGVILKVIGNLVMKAVTAPFSLLAGMFGAADEQGVVHFVQGSSALDDKAHQLLTKLPSSWSIGRHSSSLWSAGPAAGGARGLEAPAPARSGAGAKAPRRRARAASRPPMCHR